MSRTDEMISCALNKFLKLIALRLRIRHINSLGIGKRILGILNGCVIRHRISPQPELIRYLQRDMTVDADEYNWHY